MSNKIKERRLFWQNHLEKWERSALSQAAYCRENKLSGGSFSEWRRKVRFRSLSDSGAQESKSSPLVSAPGFVDVSPTPTTLEIECGKFIIHVAQEPTKSPGRDLRTSRYGHLTKENE